MIEKLQSEVPEVISYQGRRQFVRGGPLQPAFLVTWLLSLVRHGAERGYARMLETLWDEGREFGLELPQEQPVTAQAFSQARAKLPAEHVRALVGLAAEEFERVHGNGFR